LEAFNIRHSGLDPESRISVWIPAFAGMITLIYAIIYATFRFRLQISDSEFSFRNPHSRLLKSVRL
jgi:hypothetical protein